MSWVQPPSGPSAVDFGRSVREHWRLFLAEGIVLIVLGIIAIIVPPLATLATTIVLGWLFLLGGITGLITTFWARQAPGFGWALLSAILAIAAGVVLLWNPWRGAVTLTYVLIAYFIIEGILTIIWAIEHRRQFSGRWEWVLVNGIIDLILAAIVLMGLPGAFAWAIGLLVGIDLVFGGFALVGMALAARQPETTTGTAPMTR
jgi:uncharacterized membrane protein HdeD (DUF308 family)